MKRRNFIQLLIAGILIGLSGCGSRRRAQRNQSETSLSELSRKFGIRITKNDNLHLYNLASQWLGVPYRFGGRTKRGVDCSGLVGVIFRTVYNKSMAATTADILKRDCRRIGKDKLREGDLVFFHTTGKKKSPTHVGIYLKNGHFLHSSSSKGVMVSRLSEAYFMRTWLCGGRVR